MWEVMKKIAKLNNSGQKDELNKYLNSLEIESNTAIAEMAITAFDVTEENIKNNFKLAIKLSKLEHEGLRETIRTGVLEVIIKNIKGIKNVR